MSSLVITIKSEETQADIQRKYQDAADRPHEQALALAGLFRNYAAKHDRANFDVQTGSADPVAASATATLVSVPADDTIIIGGVTFTAKASPSGDNQFSQAGTDAEDATALAAKINAHPTLSQAVTASAATNVVTIRAKQKGVIGNFITLSETGTSITVSAAALAGGTGGVTEAAVSYNCGIA